MRWTRYLKTLAAAAAVTTFAALSPQAVAQMQEVMLSGANEVPAVTSTASGTASVTINADHTVTAKVVAKGMTATASHIHEAAAGANGPVIVPFVKTADNTFEAPPGSKLTDAQYESYKAGKLYVNVHSAAHPGGEIRGQLAAK
ncbi:MAG TPA: CHRD domain-containing protein [Casimicrobiaceae bacterium]|nr:CHRD domain-containing protein [Casimicrobiaceae bacterium]